MPGMEINCETENFQYTPTEKKIYTYPEIK